MNDTLRERAKALLDRIFVADAHFDLAPDLAFQHERGARKVVENQFLDDKILGLFAGHKPVR